MDSFADKPTTTTTTTGKCVFTIPGTFNLTVYKPSVTICFCVCLLEYANLEVVVLQKSRRVVPLMNEWRIFLYGRRRRVNLSQFTTIQNRRND